MSAPVEKYHHPIPNRIDWETPPALFERLAWEFGPFTLDVCATAENAKCARYFTPGDDGLAQDWGSEVCWMNPPYGKAIRAWMAKAYEASQRGAKVVCLIPARTDSAWWHEYAELADVRRFLRGRVKFVGAKHNAPFPCAVLAFLPPTTSPPTRALAQERSET